MAFAQSELPSLEPVNTGTTDWQTGTGRPRTSRTAENIDAVNDLVLSQEGAPGTYKTTLQIARETGISRRAEVIGAHHTQRHSAKVREETIEAWSGIQHSITDQAINQWQNRLNACVKDTLNICCDVFVRNCKFVMTFNACITAVMNSLTHVVFHKVV